MADTSVTEAAKAAVTSVRTYLTGQADDQIAGLGRRLKQTSESVRALGDHARSDPNVALTSQLTEQASSVIDRAATYLQDRKAHEVLDDFEAFSRKRPLIATLGATAVGFTLSRALKASATRRAQEGSGE